LHIKNAFYSPKSNINLLCFKDIHLNEYHIKTKNEGYIEYLYITQIESNKKIVYRTNYQPSLMACTTHILMQLRHISL